MDNFWDYGPDYTSSGSDLSGDWGGYDQIYIDGNTGGLTDYGSFWDSPDYSYGDIQMYLDPNTASYEAPIWLPEQPQFSFDLGSYLQPSSLSGLTDLGLIPSQIGGLDVSRAPYNDNYLSAANANALSLGLPFDTNLNLSGDEAFLQTYMATGNPAVAEQARREAEQMAEEKLLSDVVSPQLGQSMAAWAQDPRGTGLLGNDLFKPGQSYTLPDGTVVGDVSMGADVQNPYDYVTQGDSTYIMDRQTGQTVGYLDEEGNPVSYQEVRMANQSPMSGASGAAGLVGKAASAALDKALSPKEQALKRMYEQYNKQAAAKEAYQNSGTGKALTGLQGALAVAQALMGKNKGATTTARGNQGQAFSPTYVGSSAPKTMYAKGGAIEGKGGLLNLAEQMAYQLANSKGLIQGEGGGQDDVVDVKAAPGEYVMDAEIVSALGDGNNEEGARKLDQMRVNIRKHKRTGGLTSIPPKAKAPEQYMKKGK